MVLRVEPQSALASVYQVVGRLEALVERVEPEIVGGIILEARGQRFDASVKTQLATVRRTLSNAFMGGEE